MRVRLPYLTGSVLVLTALLAMLPGCGGGSQPTTQVHVYLADQPGSFDAVWVTIEQVEAARAGSGWTTLADATQMANLGIIQPIDLLQLTGTPILISQATLPAGLYTQFRLILSSAPGANQVLIDGQDYELTVPSGAQTGIKLIGGPFDFTSGVYYLVIDFQAGSSIHQTGQGAWIMRPTVTAYVQDTIPGGVGSISGDISNLATTETWVIALTAGGIPVNAAPVVASQDGTTGTFTVSALPPGTYILRIVQDGVVLSFDYDIDNDGTDDTITEITGVGVAEGQDTQLSNAITLP